MRKPCLVLCHKYLVTIRDADNNCRHDARVDHIAAFAAQCALLIVNRSLPAADATVLIATVSVGELERGKCEEHVLLLGDS